MDKLTTEEIEDLRNLCFGYEHMEQTREKLDRELSARYRAETDAELRKPIWERS